MEQTTVAISKEYLAKLHNLAEIEKRSTRSELEYLVDARLEELRQKDNDK